MKFARNLLKFRIPVFAAFTVLFVLAVPGVLKLNISVSISDFFIEGDSAREHQERFEQIFGKNNFFGVLFESGDVFSGESLEKINAIGNTILEKVPRADTIRSITTVDPRETGGYRFVFDSLGKLVSSPELNGYTTENFLNDPSLAGTLFSRNRKEAWILVPLLPATGSDDPGEFGLGEFLYNTVSAIQAEPGMTITAVGVPVYAYRKKTEMMGDLSRILLLGAVTALILCILIFRSGQTVLATLSLVVFSPLMVFGALGWLNITADSAFISVPVLLTMGVSIGNAVHVNHFFRSEFDRTGDREGSVVYALQRTWRPVLFTQVTTVAALLSFIFVQIKPIIWVGMVSASCILMVYILCMLFFPLVLSLGKNREPVILPESRKIRVMRFFESFSSWCLEHRIAILLGFALVFLAAIYGTSRVRIDFSAEKMMGTRLDHMKDRVKVRHSEISSNDYMDLTLVGSAGCFRDTLYINSLKTLQSEINALPQVKRTSSVLQIISKANRMVHKGNNRFYSIPENPATLEWMFTSIGRISPKVLEKWVTPDFSTARIFIEMTDFSSKTIQENIHHIDSLVTDHFPPGTDHFMSGYTYQMALMNQHITRGLVQSIGTALFFIFVLLSLFFRSIKLGLVAMVPNIFPVAVCGAIVGFTNIPLEFVTMTVGPLILGLAVDDTIHFISSLKTNIARENDYEKGMANSYKEVGLAITQTTVILTFTFLVFTRSDIQSSVNMGILSCVGIVSAYFADILVVPLLVKGSRVFRIRE